jgi:micrococcal nuclease
MTRSREKAGLPLVRHLAFFIFLVLCFVLPAYPALHAEEFPGQVVSIQDGDTLTVLQDGGIATRIRLSGIDAPEKRQAYSNASKQHLSSLAFGKSVRVLVKDKDRYGRTVAEVILPDGRNANQEMVRAGYAWWFRKYAPNDKALESLESEACKAKRGLWTDPHAVPPWEYRRVRRSKRSI